MSEPTVTLAELRRAVCQELRMPFFRRIGATSDVGANSTTSRIIDLALTQKDGFWSTSYFYHVPTQVSRQIVNFTNSDHTMILERPLPALPATNDDYEIHSIWNAEDILKSLNRAIKSSRQVFFNSAVDETKCLVEDVLEYDISALTVVPWILNKMYLEYPNNAIRFTASAGGATSVTAPAGTDITEVTSTYIVTIYGGLGAGQVRNVTSVAGQQINVAAWTTTPDTTSKVAVFDPTKSSWYPSHNYSLDAIEYPNKIRFAHRLPDYWGGRIRLEYLGVSNILTTEASTTIIPEEYLINKTCSLLHGQILNGTKADKESHYAEFKRYQEEADAYIVRNAPHAPSVHIHNPDAFVNNRGYNRADPLGWQD